MGMVLVLATLSAISTPAAELRPGATLAQTSDPLLTCKEDQAQLRQQYAKKCSQFGGPPPNCNAEAQCGECQTIAALIAARESECPVDR